jgi:hypothetical protein
VGFELEYDANDRVSSMDAATPNGLEFEIYLDVNVSIVVNVEIEDNTAVVFHEMEEYMEREGEFSFLHRWYSMG